MFIEHTAVHGYLGAYSRRGFRIEYYANPTELRFKDRNLKGLYEGMRSADHEFQRNLHGIATALVPVWDALEDLSGGKLKKREIEKSFTLRLPVAVPALILEIAAGQRKFDEGFRGFMRIVSQEADQSAALFGTLAGVNTTLAGLAFVPVLAPVLAPILPVTASIAGVAGAATPLSMIVGSIAKALARGEMPTKQKFKEMLEGSAMLAGKPKPTSSQVDTAYAEMKKANESGKDISADLAELETTQKRARPAVEKSRPQQPRPQQSPMLPVRTGTPSVALGVGAIALLVGGWLWLRD